MRRGLLTLALLAGCRDRTPPPPPPPAPHDGVTLIEPGTPPLTALRYHLRKGARTSSELMYDVDVISDGERSVMPTLVVDLETEVTGVGGDGAADLRITVVDASVRDRPGSQDANGVVRGQAAALRGVVIRQTLAADGAVSGARVETAGASDRASSQLDSLLRGLERTVMQLPAEPVGTGAQWRERRTLPSGGIRAVSEVTYKVIAITGDGFSYTGGGQATGEAQAVEQDGMKVEVSDTRGSTEARGSIDLARYAIDATAASTFKTTMTIAAPDAAPGAGRSTVEIATVVRMAPRAAVSAGGEAAAPGDAGTAPGDDARSPDGDHGAHSAP